MQNQSNQKHRKTSCVMHCRCTCLLTPTHMRITGVLIESHGLLFRCGLYWKKPMIRWACIRGRVSILEGFYFGFYGSYYCRACSDTCSNKERHICGGTWQLCYRFKGECFLTDSVRCENWATTLRNLQCFAIHTQPNNDETIYGEQLFVWKDCRVIACLFRRIKQDGTNKCGEIYCKTCDAFAQQANYSCYLKRLNLDPIPEKLPNHNLFRLRNMGEKRRWTYP